MKTRVIVSAIIERDGKLLFGRKEQDRGPYPNTWHILGGGVNIGEPLTDTLKREILEEAGIEVTDIEPISFDDDIEPDKHGEKTHYIFLIFKAKYLSGEPEPGDDIAELKWVEKTDLSSIELPRPSIKLFKKLDFI